MAKQLTNQIAELHHAIYNLISDITLWGQAHNSEHLLPCVRMHSRVMRLVASVCMYNIYIFIYMYVNKKQAV